MRGLFSALLLVAAAFCGEQSVFTDAVGNIILLQPHDAGRAPTLIYLSCTGGSWSDLDTARVVADSLGWNVAVCARSKNHRDPALNEQDILALVDELLSFPQVDPRGIVLFGFSGQGAQALATALRWPIRFAGVITECAHHGLIRNPNWRDAAGMPVVLITRENDWNRQSNEDMAAAFERNLLEVRLIVTPGPHRIGDSRELLSACRLMDRLIKDDGD